MKLNLQDLELIPQGAGETLAHLWEEVIEVQREYVEKTKARKKALLRGLSKLNSCRQGSKMMRFTMITLAWVRM